MKIIPLAAVFISLGVLVLSNIAVATPHERFAEGDGLQHKHDMSHKKPHKKHRRMMHKLKKIGASEEQLVDIKSIHESGKELREIKHQEIKTIRSQIKDITKQDVIDEVVLRELLASVADKKADLMMMHLSNRHQIEAILNDEQKAKLEQMRQKHSH